MRSSKVLKIFIPLALLITLYVAGPSAEKPKYNVDMADVPQEPGALESYIADNESHHKIKPDNEARIIWLDSTRKKTEYAVVYLHGFSASQKEGDPVHRQFAKTFGCNLYLSRLADHGVDTTETLMLYTADRAWNSAKEALAVGKAIGNKVILISTSTGGTLALMLAAQYPDDVYAMINMSPNIAINNPAAFLLNDPWGLYIARMVMGGNYRTTDADEEKAKYWNKTYRLESLVSLEELVESSMNEETFKKIKQPVLTLYYYKSETEQDTEVKVSAMKTMFEQLATPDSLKVITDIPDAGAHVLGGAIVSRDVKGVYNAMEKFAVEKLHLKKQTLTAD